MTIEILFWHEKISVVSPGTSIPYVAINDKPIYQRVNPGPPYHPEGFILFRLTVLMKMEVIKEGNWL